MEVKTKRANGVLQRKTCESKQAHHLGNDNICLGWRRLTDEFNEGWPAEQTSLGEAGNTGLQGIETPGDFGLGASACTNELLCFTGRLLLQPLASSGIWASVSVMPLANLLSRPNLSWHELLASLPPFCSAVLPTP